MRFVLFLTLLHLPSLVSADVCLNWFKNAVLDKEKDCLLKCVSTAVDMGTFDCPSKCKELCKTPLKEKVVFNLSSIYGLTDEERALAAKYPKKTLKSYLLSRDAEGLCSKLYKDSASNDASDACRHFVWVALLYNKYGREFSSKVLDAHEQNDKQPLREKSMDLANNRLGQREASLLIEQNKFNEDAVLKSFQDNLKRGRVVVLEESPSKNYYYSR